MGEVDREATYYNFADTSWLFDLKTSVSIICQAGKKISQSVGFLTFSITCQLTGNLLFALPPRLDRPCIHTCRFTSIANTVSDHNF